MSHYLPRRFYAWRMSGISLAVACLLSCLGWLVFNQPASASTNQPLDLLATIIVIDIVPSINDNGTCSLIEAIENANADAQVYTDCAAGSGDDTISLPDDAVMIFTTTHNLVDGGNALPVITSTITIAANGTTLVRDTSFGSVFRFFNIAPEGDLTLLDIGMRNGQSGLTGTVVLLLGGGAVLNQGRLDIRDSNLSFNNAGFGGAIYSKPITGSLTLNNTTFTSNQAQTSGGAIYNEGPGAISGGIIRLNVAQFDGGAILHSSSSLTVMNVTIQDNTAGGNGAAIAANAIVSDSQLWIQGSNIISNAAAINAGALYNSASNELAATVEITGSNISANRATSTADNEGWGGAILNGWTGDGTGGSAHIRVNRTTIADNVAQVGGGIANIDATGYTTRSAEVEILQSTLARNSALGVGSQRGSGGGLYNSNGQATVANSTISANQAIGDDEALGGRGGGIGSVGAGVTTTLTLVNSTIAFNQASQAGGGVALMAPISPTTSITATSMEIGNSLIVSNALTVTETISNAFLLASIAAPQVISGTASCSLEDSTSTSLGGNIEDGSTCGLVTGTDFTQISVILGALADNGGPTQTHMITQNGPAFDSGVDALCSAAPVNGVDQRGIVRPQQVHCDRGAVEYEFFVPSPPIQLFPQIYRFFQFGTN